MSNKALGGLIVIILVFLLGIFFLVAKQRSSSSLSENKLITTSPTPSTFQLKQTTVTLTKTGFSPQTVTINKDEGIIWTNNSGVKASINSADHPTHKKFPEINLGEVDNNSSLNHVFTKPGTYEYHNHYNPTETGIIIVK